MREDDVSRGSGEPVPVDPMSAVQPRPHTPQPPQAPIYAPTGVAVAAAAPVEPLTRVPWGAVAVYTFVAMGLAWIVALPVWLMDQEQPGFPVFFTVLASVMMFTPAIAMLVVVFIMKVPRAERPRFLGMWPLRPAKRVVWFMVASIFAPLVLVIATVAVSVAFGWLKLDLVTFSGFQQSIDAQLASLSPGAAEAAASTMLPIGLMVGLQLIAIPFGALFNSIFAFGEEIGWRGWLLPALRPLGVWPALIVSGVIWGVWHSPLILLGYNFNRTDWTGVALMTAGCVAWGMLFGWTRLRTGSVWPAVIGHGALNASAGIFMIVAAADSPMELAFVSPLGVSGWIVIAVIVLILALTKQFKIEPQLAPKAVRALPPQMY